MRNIWILMLAGAAVQGCNRGHVESMDADLLIKDVTVISVGHEIESATTNVLVQDGKIVFIGRKKTVGV